MTKRTKTELATQVSNKLPDNSSALISPLDIRSVFTDVGDSLFFWDNTIPASATETCVKGETKFGKNADDIYHLYICVDTDTWKRTELTSFQKEET